ncbi:MAG TPA: 3-dehydroquinate synthase II [Candidatus Limnocylindrales bacterium]|nr:3-dehydroquinate synthase II [Candidatus Limnocylindrales bacterium]
MKELWLEIAQSLSPQEKEHFLTIARENVDVIIQDSQAYGRSGKLDIAFIAELNEKKIAHLKNEGKIAFKVSIRGKEDENEAVKAAEHGVDYIIIDCLDWRVIPLENLIAKARGKSKLIAEVGTAEDAKLVFETLELGADGVLLKTSSPDELAKTAKMVKERTPKITLMTAKITSAKPISSGARVCVDTVDLMVPGEGMLISCQSAGFFLVEAEVNENPYVNSRPFRVNAGAASNYALASMQNTRYLSELKAGDEVLIVNREGEARITNVGRSKLEFRPLILIEAQAGDTKIKTILQNAETIRVVTPKTSKPVTELKPNDEVIVYLAAKGGRHFGVSVPEETVIEK